MIPLACQLPERQNPEEVFIAIEQNIKVIEMTFCRKCEMLAK
jgi:hypothetical protein